jgi:hypothetical protein
MPTTKKEEEDIALIPYFMLQNSSLINKNPLEKHFKHQLPLSQPWWSSATQLLLLKLMPDIVPPSQNTWLPNMSQKETSQSAHKKKSLETGRPKH